MCVNGEPFVGALGLDSHMWRFNQYALYGQFILVLVT